jgi:hypothetical protein
MPWDSFNSRPRGVRRSGFRGIHVDHADPAFSSAELKTVTTLCEGCGLVVFPREACQWCSGGAGRWLRHWLPGIETR